MSIHTSIDSSLLHAIYRYGTEPVSLESNVKASVTDLRILDLQSDPGVTLNPDLKCAALYECHQPLENAKEIVVWHIYVLDPKLVQVIRAVAVCRRCHPRSVFQAQFELSAILRDGTIGFGISLCVGIASKVVELGRMD